MRKREGKYDNDRRQRDNNEIDERKYERKGGRKEPGIKKEERRE